MADADASTTEKADTLSGKNYSLEENLTILKFVHSRTHDPDCGLVEKFRGVPNGRKMWNEYIQETGSTRPTVSLQSHFHRLIAKLPTFPLEVEAKLDIYYSLDLPVHEEFLPTAKKCAFLVLDQNNRIEMFEMMSEEQMEQIEQAEKKLQKNRKRKSEPPVRMGNFTKEETVKMWKFVLKKLTDQGSGQIVKSKKLKLSSKMLWDEFIEKENGQRSCISYISHMKKSDVHDVPLDLRAKAAILFGLSIPVQPELLAKIQEKTQVKVDASGCIVEYNSKDLISKPLRLRM